MIPSIFFSSKNPEFLFLSSWSWVCLTWDCNRNLWWYDFVFQVGKYWNRNERKAHLEQAREQKRKRQIAVLNAKLKAAAGTGASDSQSSCSLSPNATTQLKKQQQQQVLSSPSSSGNAVPSVNNNCDKAVSSASPSRQSMNVDEADQIVRSRSMEPVVLSVTTV